MVQILHILGYRGNAVPNLRLRQLFQAIILVLALSPVALFFQNCGEGDDPVPPPDVPPNHPCHLE
jgi:hypothetical protein